MNDDVCDSPTCGTCHIESCDLCGDPVAFIDDDNEAWCRSCFENYEQMQNEQMAERALASWHGGDDWQGGEATRRQIREAGR